MSTKMNDKNGCSVCKPGKEKYKKYFSRLQQRYFYQYDYRDKDGELFSCVDLTVELCRKARDKWLYDRSIKRGAS
jgi:hypothetical protein